MTDIRERALDRLERLIGEAQEAGDAPRATAISCLTALEGLGWRPTEARPAADWKLHGTGTGPSGSTRALLEQARERADQATAELRRDDPPKDVA